MDAVFLKGIVDLYGGGRESVQIMNAAWETVWSEGTYQFPDLRERLALADDWWGKPIRCLLESDGTLLRCTMRSSEHNGLRVATYLPISGEMMADQKTAVKVMQQVMGAGNSLYQALEEHELYVPQGDLNRLMSAFLKMYRTVYLRSLLESGALGDWQRQKFGLSELVGSLVEQMQMILRGSAAVEADLSGMYCCVQGDAEVFPNVLIAAVLCCVKQPQQCQNVRLSAAKSEGEVTLQIAVTPLETPVSASEQSLGMDSTEAEYQLVGAYCRTFGITMEESEQDGAHVMRLTMPTIPSDDKQTLHASNQYGELNYFDPIRVMLASFGYRDYF